MQRRLLELPHFEDVLQFSGHGDDVMVGRVVLVAVCEYEPDVAGEQLGRPVLPGRPSSASPCPGPSAA